MTSYSQTRESVSLCQETVALHHYANHKQFQDCTEVSWLVGTDLPLPRKKQLKHSRQLPLQFDYLINANCQAPASLDPVVQRGDNFIPGINNAIPRIKFIPGLNCVARSGDKFMFGINRANPGIKLTQRLSRVKILSRCFFVMKHYRKQFCRYICFSNNIPEQHCRGRIWKENQNGRIIIFDSMSFIRRLVIAKNNDILLYPL